MTILVILGFVAVALMQGIGLAKRKLWRDLAVAEALLGMGLVLSVLYVMGIFQPFIGPALNKFGGEFLKWLGLKLPVP